MRIIVHADTLMALHLPHHAFSLRRPQHEAWQMPLLSMSECVASPPQVLSVIEDEHLQHNALTTGNFVHDLLKQVH